jgi:hypothetical protein
LQENLAFRGLTARNLGPKHNYAYKPKVYSAKGQGWTSSEILQKDQGLRYKRKDLTVRILVGGRASLRYLK